MLINIPPINNIIQHEVPKKGITDPALCKIFKSMKSADDIIREAKSQFSSFFFFDIEQPHQIFARAFNIDDIKLAESLVNLMRDEQSIIDEIKFSERVDQLENDKIKLYYDCYNEKDNFPFNCIEHLIKLWLKRNGMITFDPMAQKSYIKNLIKQVDIKPGTKINLDEFRALLKKPPLGRLLVNLGFNIEKE